MTPWGLSSPSVLLACAAGAAAAPAITLKVKALPIPGFLGTGDVLGAGAAVEVSYFQVLEKAHWISASLPYGEEVVVEVPLVETAPGANDASVTSFTVKVGVAYRQGSKTVSYFTQPKRCPRGGFPAKLEMKFLSGETVTVSDTVPCPLKK